jgi:hypothetical protein
MLSLKEILNYNSVELKVVSHAMLVTPNVNVFDYAAACLQMK